MIENNPTNVEAAFEMLLEEIEVEIDFVNGVGSKAFGKRDYERVFLTAYQIWVLLQEEGNPICQTLEDKYGKAVGKHGGTNVGPAQRIGVALERSDRIEAWHLDMRRIKVLDTGKDIQPSESSCCIFRLR